jgi:predicted SAM-dependent methyltransferase
MRKGLKGVTTELVCLDANPSLSGSRDLGPLAGWRFVKELFSTKCLINPIYKSSFVILACPPRWIAQNLLRIWWQAIYQILRQGLLWLLPDSLLAAGRAVKSRIRRFGKTLRLKRQANASRPIRIVLGAGNVAIPGWILTDVDQLNILLDRDWQRFFAPDSIDAILAEHVWEHLSEQAGIEAARLCFKYLRPGGRLRIAVPDGLHPDVRYVDAVKPGGTGPGAEDHKVLYSCRSLQDALGRAGFQTRPLEYFDEDRHFHATAWDPEDGMIHRSARFDDRNRNGELRYTSIIVDAVKPAL